MAWARTVAVVVPSPATSLVLLATSRTICAPMFSSTSSSSISLATVTPSLVMTGEPNFFSITTLRPLGPSVTFTALARVLTPRRIACRDSSPCTIFFAAISMSPQALSRINREEFVASNCRPLAIGLWPFKKANCQLLLSRSGFLSLLGLLGRFGRTSQNAQDFLFPQDQKLLAIQLDFRSGIFAEQDPVAVFHSQGNRLAFFVFAGTDRNHDALLGLLFCGVRDDDAAANRLNFRDPPKQNAIM